MNKISKVTSLVINNSILKDAPALHNSMGVKIAMQFFCNVLMFGAVGGENFYPIGEIYGGVGRFFTIAPSGVSADLLEAFNACERIAAEIDVRNCPDDSFQVAMLSMHFFYPESTEFFYQLTVGFSVNGGEFIDGEELQELCS